MPHAYYNENDPFAAAWLRELIKDGHIAEGEVDERSITELRPRDVAGYTQCHFFAGIGVWSYALRCAGWPDDRPVWTGSCPCQPFSAAGKRRGAADERHLWPRWFRLIQSAKPPVVYGEQVASKDGLSWIDIVLADLESADYASWAWDLCAAGFGAPHIRQRLYFVANAQLSERRQECGARSGMAGKYAIQRERQEDSNRFAVPSPTSHQLEDLNDTESARIREHGGTVLSGEEAERLGIPRMAGGFWEDVWWVWCRDEKYRPVEPGTFPLAHGAANRVGRLRGYGNALVAPVAAGFIECFLEAERDMRYEDSVYRS